MMNTKFKNLLLGLLFCLPFTAFAQASMVGDWKMQMPDDQGNMMTLKVSMKADGTYSVDFGADGSSEIEGKYTIDGNKITIEDISGPNACPNQKAVYTFALTETSNTMTRVTDPCEGRGGPEGKMVFTRM
ncbi:MAG: lipocalin family protein [Saprospiraceae bacterium]